MATKTTTLNDIAGYDKVKKEATKLIDLLKNYDKYHAEGAFIPKGLMISGRPGVGKTLLARAIIDESHLPCYLFDGEKSYDLQKAKKYMKDTFEQAKANTPCILFIDELDQLVSGEGLGAFKTDSSEAFTKLMLTEMDGLSSSEGVFVICTSNNVDMLPEAVMRSGRMDKKIMIHAPTFKERKEIIKHYVEGNKRFSTISYDDCAKITNGFTGADLKTAVNDALIEAIHKNVKITDALLARKFDEIRFASIEQTSDEVNDRVIYHELGHAIVRLELEREYAQISIESMGYSEGFIVMGNNEDRSTQTFKQVEDSITVALAGLASEKYFTGDGSFGCQNDVSKAYKALLALGKSGAYGYGYFIPNEQLFGQTSITPTEDFKRLEKDLLTEHEEKATKIIEDNRDLIEYLKPILEKNLRLSPRDFEEAVKAYNAQKQA